MKKSILVLVCSFLGSNTFAADDLAYRYFKVKIENSALTTIQTTQEFNGNMVTLEEVFTKGFFNNQVLKSGNRLLVKQTVNGKEFVRKMPSSFTLINKAKKSGQTITLQSNCKTTRSSEGRFDIMKVKCTVDYRKSTGSFFLGIKKLFDTSVTSTSTITCKQSGSNIKCYTWNKVRPKAISIPIMSRTAQRLAVSGSSNTLNSLFNVQKALNKDGGEESVSNFHRKILNGEKGYWKTAIKALGPGEKTSSNIKIEGSLKGMSIKKSAK